MSLLSQPKFFDRHQKRLPKMMFRAVKNILRENPRVEIPDVQRMVVQQFELTRLRIAPLQAISLEVEERPYVSVYGMRASGYHAEAIVKYEGSKSLWTARRMMTLIGEWSE